MKKIFLIGTAVLGMFFMTTSCLDNTEPAGIEAMRTAKSELIRAQAEYQQALAAYQQAQIALVEAQVAAAQLDNQMKELDLQQRQLELDLQEAKNEHEIRMMELEYLLAQEENNAEIAELQMQIAELELRQLQLEIDMQDLENQKELLIQQHELELLLLQQEIAEAQLRYEQSIRALEALKNSLTDEEQAIIDNYIARIDALERELSSAEDELADAQVDYVDAKYNYNLDSTLLHKRYERLVELAQTALDDANAELAEAQALDFTDEEALLAQKTELENQIADIEKQQEDLEMQAADMALALEEPEAALAAIQKELDDMDTQIQDLREQINGAENPLNARTTRSLEVPEAIAHYVGQIFDQDIKTSTYYYQEGSYPGPEDPDYNRTLIFDSDFVYNTETGRYELPSGTVTWSTDNSNHLSILSTLYKELLDYDLSEPEKADYQERIDRLTAQYDYLVEENGRAREILPEARSEWDGLYAEYTAGIGLDNEAINAYNALEAIPDLAAEDAEANVTTLVNTIRHEQEVRFAMSGTAESNWENFTYANLTDPAATNPITLNDLFNAVNNISYNPAYDYDGSPLFYDGSLRYDAETDTADWSAANRWNYASYHLYSLPYYRGVELTPEYVGYGEYFTFSYTPEDLNVYYNILRDMSGILASLGYSDEYELVNTNFIREVWSQENISLAESHLAGLPLFSDLIADVETVQTAINDESEAGTEELRALYAELRDLYAQRDEIQVRYDEQDDTIQALEEEIAALTDPNGSEWSVLETRRGRLEEKLRIFNAVLSGTTVVVNGVEYDLASNDIDQLNQLKADWIAGLEEEIKGDGTEFRPGLEYELLEAQQTLQRLLDGEDPLKVNLEQAESRLEKAQRAYDSLIEEFNYWNDLLSSYIASLTGSETPEA